MFDRTDVKHTLGFSVQSYRFPIMLIVVQIALIDNVANLMWLIVLRSVVRCCRKHDLSSL